MPDSVMARLKAPINLAAIFSYVIYLMRLNPNLIKLNCPNPIKNSPTQATSIDELTTKITLPKKQLVQRKIVSFL